MGDFFQFGELCKLLLFILAGLGMCKAFYAFVSSYVNTL